MYDLCGDIILFSLRAQWDFQEAELVVYAGDKNMLVI